MCWAPRGSPTRPPPTPSMEGRAETSSALGGPPLSAASRQVRALHPEPGSGPQPRRGARSVCSAGASPANAALGKVTAPLGRDPRQPPAQVPPGSFREASPLGEDPRLRLTPSPLGAPAESSSAHDSREDPMPPHCLHAPTPCARVARAEPPAGSGPRHLLAGRETDWPSSSLKSRVFYDSPGCQAAFRRGALTIQGEVCSLDTRPLSPPHGSAGFEVLPLPALTGRLPLPAPHRTPAGTGARRPRPPAMSSRPVAHVHRQVAPRGRRDDRAGGWRSSKAAPEVLWPRPCRPPSTVGRAALCAPGAQDQTPSLVSFLGTLTGK